MTKNRDKIRTVLFATDLSEESARATKWLRWLSTRHHSKIFVLYVLNLLLAGMSQEELEKEKRAANQQFSDFLRKHQLNRSQFDAGLLVGDPAELVTKFVKIHGIRLLVLGSQATGVNRLIKGSVSEEIFRSVDCPVLVLGPNARRGPASIHPRRLLFATDLTETEPFAWRRLENLIKEDPSCEIMIVHFLPTAAQSVVERYSVRKSLQLQLIESVPSSLRNRITDVVVEHCAPVEGVLEFARDYGADLIVLEVRDAGPFTRAATHRPDSIIHQVISSAPCPVVTIRYPTVRNRSAREH